MFLLNLDVQITHFINSLSEKLVSLDLIFKVMTQAGPLLLVMLVASHWYSKKNREEHRHFAIQAGLASAIALGINQIIIYFFQRARPYNMGVTALVYLQKSEDPSFPSDHATLVFSIFFCAFMISKKMKSNKSEIKLYLTVAVLTCVSRVWLGTHYFSDVLGGVITALVANMLILKFYNPKNSYLQKIVKIF